MFTPFVFVDDDITGQDGAMWVRGRDAHIYYNASSPTDTITLEIQNAIGTVVYTVTKEAPGGANGHLVFPVSYQMVSDRSLV